MSTHLGLSRADAEAKLTQLQAHYAESALDAIQKTGAIIESVLERVAAVTPANASPNVAYRYGALTFELTQARYAAAALVAAMEREARCHGTRLDCPQCAITKDPAF